MQSSTKTCSTTHVGVTWLARPVVCVAKQKSRWSNLTSEELISNKQSWLLPSIVFVRQMLTQERIMHVWCRRGHHTTTRFAHTVDFCLLRAHASETFHRQLEVQLRWRCCMAAGTSAHGGRHHASREFEDATLKRVRMLQASPLNYDLTSEVEYWN